MAGLFTARMCANLVEKVIIVEPELWINTEEGTRLRYDSNGVEIDSEAPTPKRGRVFQYSILHGMGRHSSAPRIVYPVIFLLRIPNLLDLRSP